MAYLNTEFGAQLGALSTGQRRSKDSTPFFVLGAENGKRQDADARECTSGSAGTGRTGPAHRTDDSATARQLPGHYLSSGYFRDGCGCRVLALGGNYE